MNIGSSMRIGQDALAEAQRLGMPLHTPWGEPQRVKAIGPGVVQVGTAGHGGVWLSEEAWRAMPRAVRTVGTFAGGRWYEHDVDWALVAVGLPAHYSDESVYWAVQTILGRCARGGAGSEWSGVRSWLTSDDAAGAHVWQRYCAERDRRARERVYSPGSYGSARNGGQGWDIRWHPCDHDGPELVQRNAEYPPASMNYDALIAAGAVPADAR